MKVARRLASLGLVAFLAPLPAWAQRLEYPPAPRAEVVEEYHGTKVPDPFRPREDDNAPATKAWVEAENKFTFAYLEKIAARGRLKDRLTKLWDYEKYTAPRKDGGLYFYNYNTGLQNQDVLY